MDYGSRGWCLCPGQDCNYEERHFVDGHCSKYLLQTQLIPLISSNDIKIGASLLNCIIVSLKISFFFFVLFLRFYKAGVRFYSYSLDFTSKFTILFYLVFTDTHPLGSPHFPNVITSTDPCNAKLYQIRTFADFTQNFMRRQTKSTRITLF